MYGSNRLADVLKLSSVIIYAVCSHKHSVQYSISASEMTCIVSVSSVALNSTHSFLLNWTWFRWTKALVQFKCC